MGDIVFWLYLVNATLLMAHEIDSAYWQEWKLFRLPGGINFFLIFHLVVVPIVMLGLVQVHQQSLAGQILSLVLSLAGVFAFGIHTFFVTRGHPEFKTPISVLILVATLIVSVALLVTTTLWMR